MQAAGIQAIRFVGAAFALAWLLAAPASSSAQQAPAFGDAQWHEHHLRRALLYLAQSDTLAALEQLDQAAGFAALPELADRTRLLRRKALWDLGHAPGETGSTNSGLARWAVLLDLLQRLDSPFSDVGVSLDGAAGSLVVAALDLELEETAAARARLEKLDAPESLESLRDHLLATAFEASGDPSAAQAVWKRLAEREPKGHDLELIAEARLSLAQSLAARGDDPTPWLERVPENSVHRARAELMRVVHQLGTVDAEASRQALEAWLADHASHPAAYEAHLHAAALALDHERWNDALRHYESLDAAQAAARAPLDLALDDSLSSLDDESAWSRSLAIPLSREHLNEGLIPMAAEARRLDRPLPGADPKGEAKALVLAPESAQSRAGLEDRARPRARAEDREVDHRLGAEIRITDHETRSESRLTLALMEELARARGYRDEGTAQNEEVAGQLHGAASQLDSLRQRLDSVVAHLHAARDTSLARIERRTTRLLRLADENHRSVRGLQSIYVDGPMARRENPASADVPTPAQLLEREGELAARISDFLIRFRDGAPILVQRSFAEIFEPRVVDDSRRLAEEAAWQIAWSDSIGTGIDLARLDAETSPELEAAQNRHAAHVARATQLREQRHVHRVAASRVAIADALATLDARQEAVDYGLAMTHYQLGLADEESAAGRSSRAQSLSRMQAFLENHPESRARGDVRFRLADLYLMAAREDFQNRMGAFLAEGEQGASRALAPLLDYGPALDLYAAILEEDLDFPRRDAVLFHLGMIYADLSDPRAEAHLTTLVETHLDSPLLQEAQLRLGDLAFERKDFVAARPHFAAAADGELLEARAVALYKLGWSAYALDDNLAAIDAFRRLLDIYWIEQEETLSFDLADETEDLLIHAFARAGGAPTFEATFDAVGGREYEPRILTGLSQLLGEYALHEEAEAANRTFLRRFALSPRALEAAQRLIASREQYGGVESGDQARLEVFDNFRANTAWAQAQSTDSLRVAGDAFARDGLRTVALRSHQDARASKATGDWQRSRDLYGQLLTHWPGDGEAARWNYLSGECARELRDWPSALELFAVAAASDSASFAGEAAWQRVAVADAWYRSTADSTGTETSAAGEDSLARSLIQVGDEYLTRHGGEERAADLRWRQAGLAVTHEWNDEAARRFQLFAQAHPRDPRAVRAEQLRAEAFYRDERYEAAGAAFEQAWRSARTAGQDSLSTELATWIPHSYYRHAETVTADSTRGLAEAAPLWMRVADRWPDFESADRALYQAGLGLQSSGSHDEALSAWQRLLDRYPQSELAADTHRAVALDLESREQWSAAAIAWERYATDFDQETDANESLLHAAELLEKAQRPEEQNRVLDLYLARNPDDVDTRAWVLDGRARKELDAVESGQTDLGALLSTASTGAGASSAIAGLLKLAETHPDKVSPGLGARVDFLRAEELRGAYERIALTQPLKESVEAKRDRLTPLLEAYQTSAAHAVAPWAQASAYRIGEALVHFGDALVESERPGGLGGDDLLAYDEVLEEQAFEFYDKGEEAWKQLLVQGESDDADVAAWHGRAREALFPRVARRFLHQPSFEYPVLSAQAPRNAR